MYNGHSMYSYNILTVPPPPYTVSIQTDDNSLSNSQFSKAYVDIRSVSQTMN